MEQKTPLTKKQKGAQLVYNIHFAKTLLDQGFPIIDIAYNHKDPTKLVFFFEKTPELRQALNALYKKK